VAQNIFKIYDGRTNFWQWDTGQKLIVLDDNITEVHFSNRDMNHSIQRDVYELDGKRVCNVPDIILQLPRNLVAYAYIKDGNSSHTVKSVKFAVVKRPIPDGYVADQGEQVDDIKHRLEILENTLKDIELGNQQLMKFNSIHAAEVWAQENKKSGSVIAIHINSKWIAYIVEDDYSITPICDCNGEMVEVNYDGGDGDGYNKTEQIEVQTWDGGNAAGV
jgi:hypothetical protein